MNIYMTDDFSKKKGNIIFNLPNSLKMKKKIENIADDDDRVLKEIDLLTSMKSKKKIFTSDPTIEEALKIILTM